VVARRQADRVYPDVQRRGRIYRHRQDGSDARSKSPPAATCTSTVSTWSPDGKKILWGDRNNGFSMSNSPPRKVTQVAQSKAFEIREYVWSPDSKWIAYGAATVRAMNEDSSLLGRAGQGLRGDRRPA